MIFRFRTICIALIIIFGIVRYAAADEIIAAGDSVEKVFSVLGKPTGEIKSASFMMFTYPRGKIELRDRVVTKVELISQEELEQNRLKQEALQLRQAENRIKQREALLAKGTRIRSEKLSDPDFLNLPVTDQIYFWKEFRKIYPEVNVDSTYLALLDIRKEELREEEIDNKLAAMERRVAEAESRAAQAEYEAKKSRYSNSDYYPGFYYPRSTTIWYNNRKCERPELYGPRTKPAQSAFIHYPTPKPTHTVHPDSLYGNSTIRSIRSSKSQTMRSFRNRQ